MIRSDTLYIEDPEEYVRQQKELVEFYASLQGAPNNIVSGALSQDPEGAKKALMGEQTYGYEDVNPTFRKGLEGALQGMLAPAVVVKNSFLDPLGDVVSTLATELPSLAYNKATNNYAGLAENVRKLDPLTGFKNHLLEGTEDLTNWFNGEAPKEISKDFYNTALDPLTYVPLGTASKVATKSPNMVDRFSSSMRNEIKDFYGEDRGKALLNWLAKGVPETAPSLVNAADEVMLRETGVNKTLQNVVKEQVGKSSVKSLNNGNMRKGVAQAMHSILQAHIHGRVLGPQLQKIKEKVYAGDFRAATADNFVEEASKANVRVGNAKTPYKVPEVLNKKAFDLIMKQWSNDTRKPLQAGINLDFIMKQPRGNGGNHLISDVRMSGAKQGPEKGHKSPKSGISNYLNIVFDPKAKKKRASDPSGQYQYSSVDKLEENLIALSPKGDKGWKVIDKDGEGVWIRANKLVSNSFTEGGMNHLAYVKRDGTVIHYVSDFYDLNTKMTASTGVDDIVRASQENNVLTVVMPMVQDARPNYYKNKKKYVNANSGTRRKDFPENDSKTQSNDTDINVTQEELLDLTKITPEDTLTASKVANRRIAKGSALGAYGLRVEDNEEPEEN